MIQEKLDQLFELLSQNNFFGSIYESRKEYQKLAGEVYEDDKSYEIHMGLFLEWYTFDQFLPGTHLTPLETLVKQNRENWPQDLQEMYQEFTHSVHGLFSVKKIGDATVKVQNLFDDKIFKVKESQGKLLFRKNDLFEGRLVPCHESFYFTKNICFHPPETHKYIKGGTRKLSLARKDLQKQLDECNGRLKSLNKRFSKNAAGIEKINGKIEKCNSPKKAGKLKEKSGRLDEERANLHLEISKVEGELSHIEIQKLKIGWFRSCVSLMQRLSYMNLKWERSRQIDIKDIYRN